MNIQQIIDMVKNLGLPGWAMVGLVLAMIYFQWQAGNLAFLNKLPSLSKEEAADEPLDSRATAFNAVDYLIDYFEEEGCPEGAAAARSLGPHLFHPHKPDAPVA